MRAAALITNQKVFSFHGAFRQLNFPSPREANNLGYFVLFNGLYTQFNIILHAI
jgi:hypothetical protein